MPYSFYINSTTMAIPKAAALLLYEYNPFVRCDSCFDTYRLWADNSDDSSSEAPPAIDTYPDECHGATTTAILLEMYSTSLRLITVHPSFLSSQLPASSRYIFDEMENGSAILWLRLWLGMKCTNCNCFRSIRGNVVALLRRSASLPKSTSTKNCYGRYF